MPKSKFGKQAQARILVEGGGEEGKTTTFSFWNF
jgi:hypothetical protein